MRIVLLILAVAGLALSPNAQARKHRNKKAKNITCKQAGDGAKYSAVFRGVGTTKNTVELLVPGAGKPKARSLRGDCDPKDGTIELDIECSLKAKGSDDSYDLSLVSPNGADITAKIIHISGDAKEEPVTLECENK